MEGQKPNRWTRLKKPAQRALGLCLLLVLAFFLPPIPKVYQDFQADNSLILTSREGQPLRRQLSAREGVNHWVGLEDMPPLLVQAVMRAEDKRFYSHPGLDPLALARALKDNIQAKRVVSGASTITQQLLRTLDQPKDRALSTKLREMYWSLRVDLSREKADILEAYLNRVAFGPSVYGVEEASRYYFDKPAVALSPAEAAALAVTIRSPSTLDPFTHRGTEELKPWTDRLLDALAEDHILTQESAERAKAQKLELSELAPPFLAPHFCDLLLRSELAHRGVLETSLDLELQTSVEGMVKNHLALLADNRVGNAAVVVAEVETGEVLALVGSADFTHRRDGQHNAAVSLRQPGSTIKPFTYALLLQRTGQAGFILPDLDLYEDAELESFVPKNYDRHFHGPVSMRTALACSYNVPAVRALERVGTERLLLLLRRLGLSDLTQEPEHYGLGLTLGDGSTSLFQLVQAYRTLARGGMTGPLTLLKTGERGTADRVLDPKACYVIQDILSDRDARIPSFGTPNALELPFDCAVKTGTSKGYRDNWAVGFTPEHVVGVWVGNSDGSPMRDVSGITGAGPLFRDIMLTLGDGGEFVRPGGLENKDICGMSGQVARPHCPSQLSEPCVDGVLLSDCEVCEVVTEEGEESVVFRLPSLYQEWAEERGLRLPETTSENTDHLRFIYPLSGDVFLTDPDLANEFQRVKFRIAGGQPPYRWELNEDIITSQLPSLWWELKPGPHTVRVQDAQGSSTQIQVEVVGKKST